MKKIFFILTLFVLIITGVQSQKLGNKFVLTGKITGQNTGKLYLYYTNSQGKSITDSSILNKGTFAFNGAIEEPVRAWLCKKTKSMATDELNGTDIFLEPSAMTIELKVNDFKHAKISGSVTQDEAAELKKLIEPVNLQTRTLEAEYEQAGREYDMAVKNKKPEAEIDALKEKSAAIHEQFEPYQQQIANISYQFFASHPNSYVTASNLRYYVSSLSLDSLQMFYNNMDTKLQQSREGKDLADEIRKLRNGSPGSTAADFTAPDINGDKLSLSGFKGKYVLIDFWASWCVPCRHSNPHLIQLYKQYHDKGFDIIGISDDDSNPDAWKKAVAKDGIGIWHHVLRGLDIKKAMKNEPSENDISEKYGIHSLPTKILINKDGVIVGRYDKGTDEEKEAMDKKIAEIIASN